MRPIEHIKLSQTARDQLVTLKRRTKIEHWNTLCRWAFCVSLAEPSVPPEAKHPADSSVEMDWRTFGGVHQELYLALLKARCKRDGFALSNEMLAAQFRLHVHRGISYLAADREARSIRSFLEHWLSTTPS